MTLLDRVLALLGTNRTRMQWKLRAWRRRWERRVGSVQNRSKAVSYAHQVCPQCGHPAGADERTCTRCDRALGGVAMQRARRLLDLAWPADRPVVTTLLGAAIIATYAATLLWSRQFGMTGLSPHPYALIRFGSLVTTSVDSGQWWRLVTTTFLHANLLHLAFNLMSLWSVASYLEEVIGKAKTFVLYTLLGIVSSLASLGWYHLTVGAGHSVGASGAICGLIGVAIGFSLRRRNAARHLMSRYVGWAAWIVMIGFAGWGIDNAAHVGGLAAGCLVGLVVRRGAATSLPATRIWGGLVVLALGVTGTAFGFASANGLPADELAQAEELGTVGDQPFTPDFTAPVIDPNSPDVAAAIRDAAAQFERVTVAAPRERDYSWFTLHPDDYYTSNPAELLGRMRRLFGAPEHGRWALRERATGETLAIYDSDRAVLIGAATDRARTAAGRIYALVDRVPTIDYAIVVDGPDGPRRLAVEHGVASVGELAPSEGLDFYIARVTAAQGDDRVAVEIGAILYCASLRSERRDPARLATIVGYWTDIVRSAQAQDDRFVAIRWLTAAESLAKPLGVDPAPATAALAKLER